MLILWYSLINHTQTQKVNVSVPTDMKLEDHFHLKVHRCKQENKVSQACLWPDSCPKFSAKKNTIWCQRKYRLTINSPH